jgi:hypothetical protein
MNGLWSRLGRRSGRSLQGSVNVFRLPPRALEDSVNTRC